MPQTPLPFACRSSMAVGRSALGSLRGRVPWVLGASLLAACVVDPPAESPFGPPPSSAETTGTSSIPNPSSEDSGGSETTAVFPSSEEGDTAGTSGSSGPSEDDTGTTSTTGGDSTSTGVAATCVEPPPGVMGWWRGEGNVDDHLGLHDAMPSPGVAFVEGQVGQALSLAGAQTAMVTSNVPLLPEGDFSIEAWIRTSQSGVLSNIVSTYECGGTCVSMQSSSQYFFRVNDTGVVGFAMRDVDGVSQGVAGVTDVADGQFHHVVAVRDVTGGSMRVYVDGMLEADDGLMVTGPLHNHDGDTDPVIIGAQYGPAEMTPMHLFVGEIDELTLYASTLSEGTVAELFDAGELGKCP